MKLLILKLGTKSNIHSGSMKYFCDSNRNLFDISRYLSEIILNEIMDICSILQTLYILLTTMNTEEKLKQRKKTHKSNPCY